MQVLHLVRHHDLESDDVSSELSGRGFFGGQIGCLQKFGGGTALVRQMVHHARELKCRFLAASMLDKDAAGFWRCRLKGVAATRLRFWLVSFVFVLVGAVAVVVPVRLYSLS